MRFGCVRESGGVAFPLHGGLESWHVDRVAGQLLPFGMRDVMTGPSSRSKA